MEARTKTKNERAFFVVWGLVFVYAFGNSNSTAVINLSLVFVSFFYMTHDCSGLAAIERLRSAKTQPDPHQQKNKMVLDSHFLV